MCVIIYSPDGSDLVRSETLLEAADTNPDGWGVVFPHGKRGRLRVARGFGGERLVRVFEKIDHRVPVAIHCRWATHGGVHRHLTHPFSLPGGRALLHNGVSNVCVSVPKGYSDTSKLAAAVLSPMIEREGLKAALDWLDVNERGSKWLIMSPGGDVDIVGEAFGRWRDGVWYSNLNGLWSVSGGLGKHRRLWDDADADVYAAWWELEYGSAAKVQRCGDLDSVDGFGRSVKKAPKGP